MKKSYFLIILVALLIIALAIAGYFYYQNNILNKKITSSSSETQAAEAIAAVGKLLVLPDNEKPTVATVTDPSALKSQPFFLQAQIGDRVLIYTVSKEAILYRPSINKIIAVSPIIFDNPTPSSSSSTPSISQSKPKSGKK